MIAFPRDLKREDGAVAVVAALTLTVLLLFAAFVIDLGGLRADRAAGQSVADMSAAAALQVYEPTEEGSARAACLEAIEFAEENLGMTLTQVNLGCSEFPVDQVCDSGIVRRAVYESGDGDVIVRVVNPVPHGDADGLMQDVVYSSVDGTDCERLGVQVERERAFFLAGAGGSGRTGGRTIMGAVGVALGGERESASLIVLDPEGCRTLRTNGNNARIEVLEGDNGEPGIITVDTRSDCNGGQTIFDPGPNTPAIVANDRIFSNAMRFDDPNVGNASTRIQPQPVLAGPPVTRYNIDVRYNCMASYPDGEVWSPETWHPEYTLYPDSGAVSCDPADDETSPEPYLKQLHDATVGVTFDSSWGVINDCSTADQFGPDHHEDAGGDGERFYVDCSSFTPEGVEFIDATHVVVQGNVDLSGNNAEMTIRQEGNDTGTVLVSREGGINVSQPLRMADTFVYLAGTGNSAIVDFAGGAPLEWAGLTRSAAKGKCTTGPPNAACFAPMSLWANAPTGSNNRMRLVGNSDGFVQGTFFVPNAELRLTGSSGEPKLEFIGAQFFARELDARGGGEVELVPNEDSMVDTTEIGKTLIR